MIREPVPNRRAINSRPCAEAPNTKRSGSSVGEDEGVGEGPAVAVKLAVIVGVIVAVGEAVGVKVGDAAIVGLGVPVGFGVRVGSSTRVGSSGVSVTVWQALKIRSMIAENVKKRLILFILDPIKLRNAAKVDGVMSIMTSVLMNKQKSAQKAAAKRPKNPIRGLLSVISVLGIILFLSGCGGQAEEAPPLPTVFELPTVTPSFTPSLTHTPTITPSFTPSVTATTTPSLTPSATFTPSLTFTATITPTFTLTFTPTASQTFTQTATFTPTITPIAPVINSFTTSATSAPANTQITLSWNATADSARLERLNAAAQVVETFLVPPVGSQLVTVPDGSPQAIYRLVAVRGGQETSATLPITVTCLNPWFFGAQFTPADAGCPSGAASTVNGAYQPFQTGFMVHLIIPAQSANRVYGAQNDREQYLAYNNGWDGSTIIPGTPPSGLLDAQGVFNWAYNNTLASGGTWNQKIGWAITNIDNTVRTIQFGQDGSLYVDVPGGAVYRFIGGPVSGIWKKIK